MSLTASQFFFNNTDFSGQTQNLSPACTAAMLGSIDCDTSLLDMMMSNFYGMVGNTTVMDAFCRPSCGKELTTYRANVSTSCQGDKQPLPGYPATYWADVALSAWDTICLTDPDGQYCAETMAGFFGNASGTDTNGTELPGHQLCSPCVVSLFRQMQSTPYSNYDEALAGVWASIQSACGLNYPTDVQPLQTNVTTPGGYAAPGYSSAASICLSGAKYKVASGDNCESIARAHHVSTGTLMAINSVYSDCSNLAAGQTLCLPASCTTYVVQPGDTCDSIGTALSKSNVIEIDFRRLVAWNPAINGYCSNLIAGQNICVGPPGGASDYTTIAGATATRTDVYASTAASRPSAVASGTTTNCGRYYEVQLGDYCQLVALNQSIALDLFLAINPSVNSTCGNLLLGENYCVRPTRDWNATATSTVVAPPTQTPEGTTSDCYEYYTVASGDNCAKIQGQFNIGFKQLQYWNPNLHDDCSNLLLGEAYCVHGATQPPSPSHGLVARTAPADRLSIPRPTGAAEGGVPYGYPELRARTWSSGYGVALERKGGPKEKGA